MSSTADRRIVLLATDGATSRIVYHALAREFGAVAVILEERPPRRALLRRRLTTLGPWTTAGQLLFRVGVTPVLGRVGARRIAAITRDFGLDDSPIDGDVRRVPSVNSDEARRALRELDPGVTVLNGTRIVSRETLAAARGPVLNTHAGITPLYRGVHGGYWALAEGRPELVGTTVHLVDRGIDTGRVVAQATFPVSREDSFATYPYLHAAAGVPILLAAVRRALDGDLTATRNRRHLPSVLRSHPTLWGYLARRIARGVR